MGRAGTQIALSLEDFAIEVISALLPPFRAWPLASALRTYRFLNFFDYLVNLIGRRERCMDVLKIRLTAKCRYSTLAWRWLKAHLRIHSKKGSSDSIDVMRFHLRSHLSLQQHCFLPEFRWSEEKNVFICACARGRELGFLTSLSCGAP